jgi:hypothetical protein
VTIGQATVAFFAGAVVLYAAGIFVGRIGQSEAWNRPLNTGAACFVGGIVWLRYVAIPGSVSGGTVAFDTNMVLGLALASAGTLLMGISIPRWRRRSRRVKAELLQESTKHHEVDNGGFGTCPNCGREIPLASSECPHCKAQFGARGGWKVLSPMERLLSELCAKMELQVPPEERELIASAPPHDVDAFTDAVLSAAGYEPKEEAELRSEVRKFVAEHWPRAQSISRSKPKHRKQPVP